jgi:hypothetical protein
MPHPSFAIPILAIALAMLIVWRWRASQVAAVFCIFPMAAVFDVSVGDSVFSITPPMIAAALLPLCALFQGRDQSLNSVAREMSRLYLPLLCFTAIALLSSYLVPVLLVGKYDVTPAMDMAAVTPLELSRTNATQSLYLILFVIFAVSISAMLVRYPRAIRRAVDAYIWSGYIAALIGLYQFLSYQWGWFYPSEILFSRPEVRGLSALLRQYHVNGLSLTQTYGSFSEPSFFAQFLLGSTLASFNWWFRGNAPLKVKGLAVVSLAVLLMTLSTTAYVGLGCGFLLVLGRFVLKRRARAVPALCVLAMAITGVAVWVLYSSEGESLRMTAGAIADLVLMRKAESQSYSIRVAVDNIAFQDLIGTGGLGVGWGSTRGSSLLFHLLGNVGVWGVALLVWFAFRLKHKMRLTESTPARTFVAMALIGNLIGGIIAVPDIVSGTIWLLLGILVAMMVTHGGPKRAPNFGLRPHATGSGYQLKLRPITSI